MRSSWVKRAVLGSLLMATAVSLGGCIFVPVGYYRPAYAYRPVVVAPYGYYR